MVMQVEVDPFGRLRATLKEASDKLGDLTVPLTLIAQSWFKSNKAIFALAGPGKYVDLTDLYKKQKTKALGSPYPILKYTGRLEKSLTDPTNPAAISEIVNKNSLIVGTRVQSKSGAPYASFLHFGTSRMAARPVVLFGNEQVAPGALEARVEGWRRILLDWAASQVGAK
jgi:hypothetical protein